MIRKSLAILLAAILMLSIGVVGVSAAEDEIAETGTSGKVYFQVPSDWSNVSTIFCHVWRIGGDPFFSWQAKKEKCKDEGNGLWSYDLSTLDSSTTVTGGIQNDGQFPPYAIIFSANTGMQTYDLELNLACAGDTVVAGETLRSPVDSEKTCLVARWKNNGGTYHPIIQIDSLGELFDPDNTGKDPIFNQQTGELIQPGTGNQGNTDASNNNGGNSGGTNNGGNSGGNNSGGSNNGGSNNSGTNSGGSNGGSNSGSGGSGGSGSNSVNSGQDTDMLFIALGAMLAAAAVVAVFIIIGKKKVKQS